MFWARSFLFAAVSRSAETDVGAASMGSSSSPDAKTAGRLSDGAGSAGFGLLRENESFISMGGV